MIYRYKPFIFMIIMLAFFQIHHGCSSISTGRNVSYPKTQNLQNQENIIIDRYGSSLRRTIDKITILVLRGTHEEMGEAHGVLAGKEIIQLLDNVIIPYVNKRANLWESKVLPGAAVFTFPEEYEKELIWMMKGIEKKYPARNDRMLSSLTREIKIEDLRALNCLAELIGSVSGCSSFSAWGSLVENGDVICGRNLDERFIPGEIPFMVIARQISDPGRKATLDIGGPGVIGISTGMNEDGMIAILHNGNGLPSPTGNIMPRTIVMREAIELAGSFDSVEKIADFFKNRRVHLGSSTHIAFPVHESEKKIHPFVVEWDGNSRDNGATVRKKDPSQISDAIVCTNHFVIRRQNKTGISKNSHLRYKRLVDLLKKSHASRSVITIDKAIEIMDSVVVSGEKVTYLTWIAIPKDKKLVFAVTPGLGIPATRGEWIELSWDEIFGEF